VRYQQRKYRIDVRNCLMTPHRVVVTGGAGFVGRHVVAALRACGHQTVVADRRQDPSVDVRGDLRDPEVMSAALDGADAVVHLAAETSVLGSMERPAEVHRTNVDLTADLLEQCRLRGVGTLVFASTNAVVGAVTGTITEAMPLAPLTPYGATKAAAEMLLSGYAGAYGIRAVSLRFSNVYGPGMAQKDSLVPRLFRAAMCGGGIEVYGDGRQRRDLVSVLEVARAAVQAMEEDWPSGPVIIGSGRSYEVLEIIHAARAATGVEIPVSHVPAKPGEMPAVVVDTSRARSLGWTPGVDLEAGMREAWQDFRRTAEA
jgi:UDP-glucose 4-epimerase